MPFTTFTELKNAIAGRMHRSDLTSVIPDFITFAEKRLSRRLRVSGLEVVSTISCVAGTPNYALPSGFASIRSVNIAGDPVRNLEYLTPDTADKIFGSSETSKPYGYSIIGGELYLFYTPDSDYKVNIVYYSTPTALSDANITNWYLTDATDALFYACMIEACSHVSDDQGIAKWSGLYERAVGELEAADQLDKWSGSNMRTRVA
jgi:hypothetical protein